MDLGIAGRKAIVCASSRGLGHGCALALAQAGCEVVVNGRDKARLEAAAAEIGAATGAKVTAVVADVATADGQAALFAACPEPDILVNNNGGPPFRDFRELNRQQMIDGVIGNMVVAIELIQKASEPMIRRRFGRIVNITSRSVAASNVTINCLLPGTFDTDRLRSNMEMTAKRRGISVEAARAERIATVP